MYNKNVNSKVIKAITVGLSAIMAFQPVATTMVWAAEPQATEKTAIEKAEDEILEGGKEANDPVDPLAKALGYEKHLTDDATKLAGEAVDILEGKGKSETTVDKDLENAEKKVVAIIGTQSDVEGNGDENDNSNVDAAADTSMNAADEHLGIANATLDEKMDSFKETLSDENIKNVTEAEANDIVASLKKAQADAKVEADAAKEDLEAAEGELADAKKALEDAAKASGDAKKAAEERVAAAQAKVDEAYNEVARVNGIVSTINGYVDKTKLAIEAQQAKIDVDASKEALDESKKALNESIDNLKDGTEDLKNAAKDFSDSVAALKTSVDNFSKAIDTAASTQATIEELRKEYDDAQKAYADIEEDYAEAIAAWNAMKENQIAEGYTQEDLNKAGKVVEDLETAKNNANTALGEAEAALKKFEDSAYAKTIKAEQEKYNAEDATDADKAAAAKAMAEAVIQKEFAGDAVVTFSNGAEEEKYGKSENGFFYYIENVENEDGTTTEKVRRYTYLDDGNGVVTIYEMIPEATYTATYNGTEYEVTTTKGEDGTTTQTITIGEGESSKQVTILGTSGSEYFEEAVASDSVGTVKEKTEDITSFKITVSFPWTTHKILVPYLIDASNIINGVYEFNYIGDTYKLTQTGSGFSIQYATKSRGKIIGWSDPLEPSISDKVFREIDVPAIDGKKLKPVSDVNDNKLFTTSDGKTYEKQEDGSYIERISIAVVADAVDENTNYIKGKDTDKSSAQYNSLLIAYQDAKKDRGSELSAAEDKYKDAAAVLKRLADNKSAKDEANRTDLNVTMGLKIDTPDYTVPIIGTTISGIHEQLALGTGNIANLPVDIDDLDIDIQSIYEKITDETERQAVIDAIGTAINPESGDIEKIEALFTIMGALGNDKINPQDGIALIYAADPNYVDTLVQKLGSEKGLPEWLTTALSYGEELVSQQRIITPFQEKYATAWLAAFTAKIEVVNAGIDVVEAVVGENALKGELGGVVGSTIALAEATKAEIPLVADTAAKALDYALAGFNYASAEGGLYILDLADILVTKLDKYVDALNKETQQAEDEMLEAKEALEAVKITAPGSQQLKDAQDAYNEAAKRYEGFSDKLDELTDKLEAAKTLQEKAQTLADELEAARKRAEEEANRGGEGGGGTTGGGATGGGVTGITSVIFPEGITAPILLSVDAGVAGARRTGRVASTGNTVGDAGDGDDEELKGTDDGAAKVEEDVEEEPEEKKVTEPTIINDEEVAKAEVGVDVEKKISWWWLLLIAALLVAGEETYRRNKNKKEKEKELQQSFNKQ